MFKTNVRFREFGESFNDFQRAKSIFEETHYSEKTNPITKTITFQVTEACNLACTYCYQINKSNSTMTVETAKKFIDLLIEESYKEGSYVYLEDTPCVILEFIGGEPLLAIDIIDEAVDYFKYKTMSLNHPWAINYMISMISNGVLYFDQRVQDFLQKNKSKIDFSISMDGCKELHDSCRVFHNGDGSYDLVEEACLYHMEHYNEKMSTKLTIAPENIDWVSKAMDNLVGLGYKQIMANCIYEEGWNRNLATKFYYQLKQVADYIIDRDLEKDIFISLFEEDSFNQMLPTDNNNYCGTTGSMLAVNPIGEIFTCLRFMKSSIGGNAKEYTIGDIETGIGRKPLYENRINILNSITRKSQSTDECFNCEISSGCGWCTAYNYQETGTPDKRVTYICEMHRARSLGNAYYWNKIYKKHNLSDVFNVNLKKESALNIISEEEYNMIIELTKR